MKKILKKVLFLIKSTDFISLIILSSVLLFIFISCNKQNQQNQQKNEQITNEQAAKDLIALQIKKNGIAVTVPLHQRMDFYYGDVNGNRLTPPKSIGRTATNSTESNSFISGCDGDPSGYAVINTYTLITDCINGYKISFNTTVSTDDNIVAVNPYNSLQTSKGSIRVYDPSNNLVYSDLTIPMDASTNPPIDLGADPSNPGYELLSVTFTSGWISSSVFDPIGAYYTMKLGGFYESDCSDYEHSNGGLWVSTYTSIQFPNADPLSRIDPIWPVSTSGSPFEFYGEDPIGNCTMSGYTYPHLQEIQYSIDGGSTWIGESASSTLNYIGALATGLYTNLVNGTGGGHYGYVDPYGVLELAITLTGHGTILIRDRNIMFNVSPPTGGIWPIPAIGSNCAEGIWSTTSSYTY